MARRIATVGLVTVSERRSMYPLALMVLPRPWFVVHGRRAAGLTTLAPAGPRDTEAELSAGL